MVENIRKALDKGGNYAALLKNLSEAFECIRQDLIIAKVHAYTFDMPSLKFMNSCLTNSHQIIKMNNNYSLWQLIKYDVPQGGYRRCIIENVFT